MKPALISDELNESLNNLVGYGFLGNRILDRDMSLLSVKFVMVNSTKYLHVGFSHLYPLLSDLISNYQESRNNLTVYPQTPIGDKDYNTPQELFDNFYKYQIEYEQAVKEAIEQADSENDLVTKKFLEDFLITLNKYTNQATLLCDRCESYQGNWMDFDRDIKKFFLFGD